MVDAEDENVRAWVAAWRRAGPILEKIRREELRAFSHEEHAELIDALLQIGCDIGCERPTSGLVEQQRLFGKART